MENFKGCFNLGFFSFYLFKLGIVYTIFTLRFDIFYFSSISNCSNSAIGYLPNSIHAVEAMLAAASIGAIWSSTSPDFGINVSSLIACSRKAAIVFQTNVKVIKWQIDSVHFSLAATSWYGQVYQIFF